MKPISLLATLAVTILTAFAPASAADPAGTTAWERCLGGQRVLVTSRLKNGGKPNPVPPMAMAYLVNGFTGCCIPEKVEKHLRGRGACVHESNWNHIDRKGNPGDINPFDARTLSWRAEPKPETDEEFVNAMRAAIRALPKDVPLILIGHSFGGDAVLQVARRIDGRPVAFLGVLDGVGRGGLRKNITTPVPKNVQYFFNRWQQSPPLAGDHMIPFDRTLSGKIESRAARESQAHQNTEKTAKCESKYRDPLKKIPQLLSHGEVPNDACIQRKMIEILDERVFSAAAR